VLANVAIGVGLVAAAFGKAWYPTAANLMTGYSFTRVPELYVHESSRIVRAILAVRALAAGVHNRAGRLPDFAITTG
jgi:hypothetical protein